MKKQLLFTIMITMAFTMLFRADSFGQLLMNENFDYVAGSQLITNGWAQTGTVVTNPILVSNGGLTYPTYMSSGIGNAASLVTTGQDVNYTFTTVNSGTLYAGFLVNVASSQTAGDYFIHFIQPPLTINNSVFKGRVFIKKDPASTNFAFGISKSSTAAASVAYTPFSYSLNTTYLVVLKYEFVAGTTTNDNIGIFINPTPGAAEPASPTLSYIDNTQTDATSLGLIGLRQGTGSNAAVVQVDGIRIGQTWADATAMEVIVPTLSEWGLIFLGLALLAAGTFYITRMKG